MPYRGLVSAIRTLTIVPVLGSEPQNRTAALPWFAVAGAVIGFVQFGFAESMRFAPASIMPLAGIFLTVINYALTGGLHLDGLADTADAFGIRHSRDKTLVIMKDPHIGSFGVGALVIVLLWRVIVYQEIAIRHAAIWIVFPIIFSRLLQALMLCRLPYARGTEGKAHGFRGTISMTIVLTAQAAALSVILWQMGGMRLAVVSTLCGLGVVVPLVATSLRRIGGITGDVAGAVTELFECAFLTGVIACIP